MSELLRCRSRTAQGSRACLVLLAFFAAVPGCAGAEENLTPQQASSRLAPASGAEPRLSRLWDLYIVDKAIDVERYRLGERLLLAETSELTTWERQRLRQLLIVLDEGRSRTDRARALDAFCSTPPVSPGATSRPSQRFDWAEWYDSNWPWIDLPVPF